MKIFSRFIFKRSHHIRGPNGINATELEITKNIELYKYIGGQIRAYFIEWYQQDAFPKIELYVPADHDEFVQVAFNKNYIDEVQILDVDCTIIDSCSLVIAYGSIELSRGMKVEVEHAVGVQVPVYFMPSLSEGSIGSLKFTIHTLLKQEE